MEVLEKLILNKKSEESGQIIEELLTYGALLPESYSYAERHCLRNNIGFKVAEPENPQGQESRSQTLNFALKLNFALRRAENT
ncbi:hypothetical protein Ddc_15687 [Ditylenchus destructor]|nr:hypothetical protein Ddc_15687 [Ditylenchus destructor]